MFSVLLVCGAFSCGELHVVIFKFSIDDSIVLSLKSLAISFHFIENHTNFS